MIVWDIESSKNDFCPPNTINHTVCGDSCSVESEWFIRSVSESGRGSCMKSVIQKFTNLNVKQINNNKNYLELVFNSNSTWFTGWPTIFSQSGFDTLLTSLNLKMWWLRVDTKVQPVRHQRSYCLPHSDWLHNGLKPISVLMETWWCTCEAKANSSNLSTET